MNENFQGSPKATDICIDCDGYGRYPSGASCISCGGIGRVFEGDGIKQTEGRQRSRALPHDGKTQR